MASEEKQKRRLQGTGLHPDVFRFFDGYTHGFISRREFLEGVSRFAVGGITAAAILDAFTPDYAFGQKVAEADPRIIGNYVSYPSPRGHEGMEGYFARPANRPGPLPGVVVIHGAAGIDPHFEDVARRMALENFVAFAPDAVSPLGGHAVSGSASGNREKGREMMDQMDPDRRLQDFIAAVHFLRTHPLTNGQVGIMGFCWGGGTVNTLAVMMPDLDAGVSYYGMQPDANEVPEIHAPLLIHYAGLDERVNAGWPVYREALNQAGTDYTTHMYEAAQHAFNNDTDGPRYNEDASTLAWERTVNFFNLQLH
jgi:carboxymethylenebutenolidase